MARDDYRREYDRYEGRRYETGRDEGERPRRKAPLPFRILAWLSLMAIFFAVGYGATSLAFRYMDDRGRRITGTVTSPEEVQMRPLSEDVAQAGGGSLRVYVPSGESFEERDFKVPVAGSDEEAMRAVLDFLLAELRSSGWMADSVRVLHLFRSGDWLYLNLNGAFYEGLKGLGKDRAGMVITAIVKTMQDNFKPTRKVKFYVDGQDVSDRSVVDLSKPWTIKN